MNLKSQIVNLKNYKVLPIFYFIFSLAIISRIVCDLYLNRVGIHLGNIFPVRKLNSNVPPYDVIILYLELALAFIGAVLFNTKNIRLAAFFVTCSYLMGLSQLYQNQKVLILIISMTLLILPASKQNFRSIWFLRCQFILLYGYSFLYKMLNHFYDGKVLVILFKYLQSIQSNSEIKAIILFCSTPLIAKMLALLTLFLEFLIPAVIIKRPLTGIALVAIFHLSLNLIMNDIFPFTVTMVALSLLFLLDPNDPALVLDN